MDQWADHPLDEWTSCPAENVWISVSQSPRQRHQMPCPVHNSKTPTQLLLLRPVLLPLSKYSMLQSSICNLCCVLTLVSTHGAFSLCEWITVMSCEMTGRAVRSNVCLLSLSSFSRFLIMVTNVCAHQFPVNGRKVSA